jgi:hypothetical protein
VIRLMRTIGVPPMASRTVLLIGFTRTVYTFADSSRDWGFGIRDWRITLSRRLSNTNVEPEPEPEP